MTTEHTPMYLAIDARHQAKMASIKGYHVNLGFLESYFTCLKAVHNQQPKGQMPIASLRAYARYARLSMAVNILLEQPTPKRLARMKVAKEKAWQRYHAREHTVAA